MPVHTRRNYGQKNLKSKNNDQKVQVSGLPQRKPTIMVVDDEPDVLRIITKMLEMDGFHVHAFNSPEQALEHTEIHRCKECAVLVSDVRMPGINGIGLARLIKTMRPEMKIILMSAFEIQEEWRNSMPSLVVDALIQKPFKTSDLADLIKKYAAAEAVT